MTGVDHVHDGVREAPLACWFYRHAEIASHRGDLPATPAGLARAEQVGEALAAACPEGARVELLHAPTTRTLQTAEASDTVPRMSLAESVEAFEKDLLLDALKTSRGNRARAAKLLGTTERIFNYKVRKYRIGVERFR